MGRDDTFPDCSAGLAGLAFAGQDNMPRSGDLDEQVNSVEKRSRYLAPVAAYLHRAANAILRLVAMKTTGAGMRCLFTNYSGFA
jgi:hypothetical protein